MRINHLPVFDPMWTDTSFLPSSVTPRTWSLMMSATIKSLSESYDVNTRQWDDLENLQEEDDNRNSNETS